MAISRNGQTPPYYEYGTKFVIVKDKNYTKQQLLDPVSITDPHMVYIPSYQRKLVWKKEDIVKLINTKSNLYGTVILATWSTDPESPMTLVDGLQRLGVITAFLTHLYPLVLSTNPSDQTNAPLFSRLSINAERYHPVYEHNHNILLNHPRIGIRESYKEISDVVESYVKEQLKNSPQEFAKKCISSLMDRYVAIDPYYGFKSDKELTDTFLNINSTGVDLSDVDLLRSEILSQAYQLGWPEQDTLDIENEFTEVFQPAKGVINFGMKVLGENIYEAIQDNRTTTQSTPKKFLFKTWDNLDKNEIECLLDFLELAKNAGDDRLPNKTQKWKELSEIYRCGDLPFAITVWYFYLQYYLKKRIPDFIGGTVDTTVDCRLLLRAFYRRLLDGSIGQITKVMQDIITEKISTVHQIVENVNPEGKIGTMDREPPIQWLIQSLRTIDPTKSKRIFNACMLPDRGMMGSFEPKLFENRSGAWNIDHLIPVKHKIINEEGEKQINQLVNLAPLTYDQNHLAKITPCEVKLQHNGVYSSVQSEHPYVKWLCTIHYTNHLNDPKISSPQGNKTTLNSQTCLTINSAPAIGNERINEIAQILKTKL